MVTYSHFSFNVTYVYNWYFPLQGVDLVPSDVAAGLILLSRKQERKRQRLQLYDVTESKRYNLVLVLAC